MSASANPASRVLTVLERLQERPGLSAPQLAADLGVTERTVRRYIATLQAMDIPIAASKGPYGGYRLAPGYRMPPLMLTTDEAVVMALALTALRPGIVEGEVPLPADVSSAGLRALGKLTRVLPREVAERVDHVRAAVSAPADLDAIIPGRAPQPGVLVPLAEGVVGQHQCRIRHRGQDGPVTVRDVNPYGVVALHGGWYLHGWCHLRKARRTFRIDRIDRVDVLAKGFRAPSGLDVVAEVQRSIALSRSWSVVLLVHAGREQVEPWVPRQLGVLESSGDDETLLRSSTSNLDYFVMRISDLPFDFTVVQPDELRKTFARQAERFADIARR